MTRGTQTMARKVFQDFAHVVCQKFIEVPSNTDLVKLAVLGDGKLELDLIAGKASHNRGAISPLPYMKETREWIECRLTELQIPSVELLSATLVAEYTVTLHRLPPLHWLSAKFEFACTGIIRASDREYVSEMKANKESDLADFE